MNNIEIICANFDMNDEIVKNANVIFRSFGTLKIIPFINSKGGKLNVGMLSDSSENGVWVAIAIFIAHFPDMKGTTNKMDSSVLLESLLSVANVPMKLFLSSFTVLCNRILLPPEVLDKVSALQERYKVTGLLYVKYVGLWHQFGNTDACTADEEHSVLFKLGWVLYLVAERVLEKEYSGLAEKYILLLAVVHNLISTPCTTSVEVEVAAALSALGSYSAGSENNQVGNDLLSKMIENPPVRRADVQLAMRKVLSIITDLDEQNTFVASTLNNDVRFPLYFYQQDVQVKNFRNLNQFYGILCVANIYDYDGRLEWNRNLEQEACLLRQDSLNAENPSPIREKWQHTQQAWQVQGKPPPEPNNIDRKYLGGLLKKSALIQTPVTAAVIIDVWVKSLCSNNKDSNPPKLTKTFATCEKNPSEFINNAVQNVWKNVQDKSSTLYASKALFGKTQTDNIAKSSIPETKEIKSETPPSIAAKDELMQLNLLESKCLALKLFYKTLDSILVAEQNRVSEIVVHKLLFSKSFHEALFCVCLEIGFKWNGFASLAFPRLLTLANVNAFDFGIVIESFVKNAPALPSQFKQHMKKIEHTVLESEAWQSNSVLHILLAARTGSNDRKYCAASIRTSISKFYRKLVALAASRIHLLCKSNNVPNQFVNQIWTVAKECITKHYTLLRGRHLDTLLLCSLYGLCKINQKAKLLSFQSITAVYIRMNPLAQHKQIIHSIPATNGETMDIVTFYNRCYIHAMKEYLLQFRNQESDAAMRKDIESAGTLIRDITKSNNLAILEENALKTAGSTSPTFATQPGTALQSTDIPIAEIETLPMQHTTPKQIPNTNIYISPRQSTKVKHFVTPRTHALYAFGESPSKVFYLLQIISSLMKLGLAPHQ